MPGTITTQGYAEDPYLSNPYESGQVQNGSGFQVTQVITSSKIVGMQATQVVTVSVPKGMQASQTVSKTLAKGMQASMTVSKQIAKGMQSSQYILNRTNTPGMQTQMILGNNPTSGMQAQGYINKQMNPGMQALMTEIQQFMNGMQAKMFEDRNSNGGMQASQTVAKQKNISFQAYMDVNLNLKSSMQAYMDIAGTGRIGMDAKQDKLRHALHEVYLEFGYLEGEYLTELMCAFLGMQANQINKIEYPTGMQVSQTIAGNKKNSGQQVLMVVNTQKNNGMQAQMFNQFALSMQATMVIYNTTQLRIMTVFPSRGTAALAGLNWTSTSTATGDFSPNNINTDIIEQVFRSNAGSAALVTLTSDTGLSQGVPLDTIAILGHNLTKSATVQVQGSNDPLFGTINVSITMTTESDNMYYIAPSFPNLAGQNRYWRFVIQDPTNTSGYIQIGAILYGASHLFSVLESFDNPIVRGFRHFKDELKNEGFTAIMNDRALKKFLKLRFNKLNYFNRNYSILEDMLTFARTSLKVLVIPTPEYPSRFAVYGKLVSMPDITHQSVGSREEYIDLDLEWDESL